jgi:hypothetical protein
VSEVGWKMDLALELIMEKRLKNTQNQTQINKKEIKDNKIIEVILLLP